MINYRRGKVVKISRSYRGCTEINVVTDAGEQRAINYESLTGKIQEGDDVLLNTTAVDLGLGSGGYHFVVCVNDGARVLDEKKLHKSDGHIMKLRYTPMQFSVLSAEEQASSHHERFNEFQSLMGMPVIIGELHSMLAAAVFNINGQNRNLNVSYIMTDGGALPANFSRNVQFLKQKGLLQATITFGQAFGGDYEAVNIYTALITAKEVVKSDIAVVTMGPGITGTGTKYGFSGIEQGTIIDAVNTLGGRPIFIPRISFADKRQRHYGISHHSITILKEIAKTPAQVIIPRFPKEKYEYITNQLKAHGIDQKHEIIVVKEQQEVLKNISNCGIKLSTMGRGLEQDTEFFLTAGSAGYHSAYISQEPSP